MPRRRCEACCPSHAGGAVRRAGRVHTGRRASDLQSNRSPTPKLSGRERKGFKCPYNRQFNPFLLEHRRFGVNRRLPRRPPDHAARRRPEAPPGPTNHPAGLAQPPGPPGRPRPRIDQPPSPDHPQPPQNHPAPPEPQLRRTRTDPLPRGGSRPRLSGSQQPLAQLLLELGRGIERGDLGQLVQGGEPEQAQEQLGGAVEHGAELGAPGLLDQPALEQRGRGRLGVDTADAGDLRPRDRLQVGDDGQRLGLGGRQRRRARPRQQAPGGVLGVGVGGRARIRPPARAARGRGARTRSARADAPARSPPRAAPPRVPARALGAHRLGAEEQQRFQGSLELGAHQAASIRARGRARPAPARADSSVISPNGSSWVQVSSPCL